MADTHLRDLERAAQTGDPEAQRRYLCHSIGRLQVEVPLQPSLLSKLGKGSYAGQTLWEDPQSGVVHPCVKWNTWSSVDLFDLVDEKRVHTQSTLMSTMSLVPAPTSIGSRSVAQSIAHYSPTMSDAMRRLTGHGGQGPGFMPGVNMIANPWMPEDQVLFVDAPIFDRLYPARFNSLEGDNDEGESGEEAEGEEARGRDPGIPSDEG